MQYEPPSPDLYGERQGQTRTSATATLSLVSGLLSFICLFGLGGVAAIGLGWLAHGEIERSGGRLSGKGLANTGIGLGIANLVSTVVVLGVALALALRPGTHKISLGTPPSPPAPVPVLPRPPARAPRVAEAPPDVEAELPSLPPRVGKIAIVEAADGQGGLESKLLSQLDEAAKSGEVVVLWTVTPDCEPCAAVGRALPDARMQRALSKVRLVRADAGAFTVELKHLGVPLDSVPGFTLLDTHARALDYIHGGEWDADIPGNIAPILDKFLRRTLSSRRHPWARPLRDDETPL